MRLFCALTLFIAGLAAAPTAQAAYTTATVASIDASLPDGSGGVRVVVTCGGGNAGEPTLPTSFTLSGGFSALSDVQMQAWSACDALARNKAVQTLLTVGQSLTRFTPSAPSVVGQARFLAATTVSAGTTPQDVCTLTGSATKTIIVNKMWLSSTQTTAGVNPWFVVKRSTANSAGTSTATAITAVDTLSPAPSAVARTYTVNPTAGTLIGRLDARYIVSPAPATAGLGRPDTDISTASGITLRGVGEVLAWNFNGAALPAGLSVACGFDWSEQ